MAKFRGAIGLVEEIETAPDVYEQKAIERKYRGDFVRNTRRWDNSEHLNDNLTLNNEISIVADSYLYKHIYAMRYVKFEGTAWEITNITLQRPRIILSVGGIYNGPTP